MLKLNNPYNFKELIDVCKDRKIPEFLYMKYLVASRFNTADHTADVIIKSKLMRCLWATNYPIEQCLADALIEMTKRYNEFEDQIFRERMAKYTDEEKVGIMYNLKVV